MRRTFEYNWDIFLVLLVVIVSILAMLVAMGLSIRQGTEENCRAVEALNPDWQFHYDVETGCRVLYKGYWVPVDDLPQALEGEW
jgi:hypothetical protein